MLCAICTALIKCIPLFSYCPAPDYENNTRHQSLHELKNSVLEGCVVCKRILVHIGRQYEDGETWLENALLTVDHNARLIGYKAYHYGDSCSVRYSLPYDAQGGVFANIKMPQLVFSSPQIDPTIPSITPQSTSTADAIDLWRYWFRTCSESHPVCREKELGLQHFLPSRLIEILDTGDTLHWRLVSGLDINTTRYVTLSHCWGESEHIKLIKDKVAPFREKQPESILPQTYRDAIRVALSLGVPYIWIDSICIIQDDPDDWKNQASLMGQIYHNACCNIAASWGTDGTDGCFNPERSCLKSDVSTRIKMDGDHGPEEYLVTDEDIYKSEVIEAPLNRRGWVIQERYLARKQLSFAKSQVYWECLELSASEDFPKGIPKQMQDPYQESMASAKPSLNPVGRSQLRFIWSKVVESYSMCDLTKPSDKTVALAGLASEMKAATGYTYLAGLWEEDIEKQLLWESREPSQHFPLKHSPYIAPTWSWMSLDGPVRYDTKYGYQHIQEYTRSRYGPSCPPLIRILKASIEAGSSDNMHSFVSGTLELRGIAIRAVATRIMDFRSPGSMYRLEIVNHAKVINDTWTRPIIVVIWWDENVASKLYDPEGWYRLKKERAQSLLFMFVLDGDRSHWKEGLVLERLRGQEEKYRRLGVFGTQHLASGKFDLGYVIRRKLGLEPIMNHTYGWTPIAQKDFNLEDERLKDLVYTVTIV
ncbi:HET-domain-containing protein [Annulohypoxylon maeteangense]|uniref:HET-domain-containing protein n=1 Tax=Annulohypoxylon maeteangense TaxID=1927788 RepID=UPI00200801A4|nr:HET-domain-containing protein [Annulohypoxylon maeteangense]KAI0888758.1 HET-domain-containing protein [Annulohypoxylon maeteangense]